VANRKVREDRITGVSFAHAAMRTKEMIATHTGLRGIMRAVRRRLSELFRMAKGVTGKERCNVDGCCGSGNVGHIIRSGEPATRLTGDARGDQDH